MVEEGLQFFGVNALGRLVCSLDVKVINIGPLLTNFPLKNVSIHALGFKKTGQSLE